MFNPRTDRWEEHFAIRDARIEGLTPEGRVAVEVLQLNRDDLVELRRVLIGKGRYP